MNGVEQRQRHTAVATVERRVEDLQTITVGLGDDIVALRDGVHDRFGALGRRLRDVDVEVNARVDQLHARPVLMVNTLWQRLRWIVRGR